MSPPDKPARIDLDAPSVPVEFARLVLQMCAERGVPRERMLAGLDIDPATVDRDGASLSIRQHMRLLLKAVDLSGGEGGLGLELGLRIGLSTHSMVAVMMLSQMTIGDAIRLGIEFSQMIVPVYRGRLEEVDGFAVLDISMDQPVPERLHRYAYDLALVSVWSGMLSLFGGVWPEVELWFDYPEPDYFAAYRERLPACRFGMGANQICFPAAQLARRIQTGDPVLAQLAKEKMLRELEARRQQGETGILALLAPLLVRGPDGYPDMEAVCARLCMSTRTLKRKLQQAGTSFQVLLDEVRRQDAIRLLASPDHSIERVATWMGFAEPSNFTHAFKRWTGMTPSEWRRRRLEE